MAPVWPDNSFASLRRVADPGFVDNIEGLWMLDQGDTDATDALSGAALDLVVAMTLGHALLPEALAFHRGWLGVELYLGLKTPTAEPTARADPEAATEE
jgi:hypothetical protein